MKYYETQMGKSPAISAHFQAGNCFRQPAIWFDQEGKVLAANAAFTRLGHYAPFLVDDLYIFDLDPHASRFGWKKFCQQLKAKKRYKEKTEWLFEGSKIIPLRLHWHYLIIDQKEMCCASIENLIEDYRYQDFWNKGATHAQLAAWEWNNHQDSFFFTKEISHFFPIASSKTMGKQQVLRRLLFYLQETNFRKFMQTFQAALDRRVSFDIIFPAQDTSVNYKLSTEPVFIEDHLIKIYGIIQAIPINKRSIGNEMTLSPVEDQLVDGNIPIKSHKRSQEFDFLIGESQIFQRLIKNVKKIALSDSTVLITGETGTGKELLAQALHQLSDRVDYPLIKINCASLPEHLIEGELFGYEAGAFTGAIKQKKGKFELAHKGTLFLDEIGELPLGLQAKLLRVLQDNTFDRLGGSKSIYSDVRIFAATNRNLAQMVKNGSFREDLYYRLYVLQLDSPPLRKRKEDLPFLINHFLNDLRRKNGKTFSTISKAALNELYTYNFPGNVRELSNIIERAVALSDEPYLNLNVAMPVKEKISYENKSFLPLDEVQRRHIIKAIQKCKGRISGPRGAAKLLRINDKTLYSRMERLKIDRHKIKQEEI